VTTKSDRQALVFSPAEDVENIEVATDGEWVYTRCRLDAPSAPSASGKSDTIAKTGFPKVLLTTKDGRKIMIGMTVGIKR